MEDKLYREYTTGVLPIEDTGGILSRSLSYVKQATPVEAEEQQYH